MVTVQDGLQALEELLQEAGAASRPYADAAQLLYKAVSPELPTDMVTQPVTSPLRPGVDAKYVSKFSLDEGHNGRFTLFGTDGASLDPKAVFDKPDPFGYIREVLSYGDIDAGECVIFVPGLNTPHQVYKGGASSPQRLKYYSNMLEGRSMAQVHTGTSVDQGNVKIDTSKAPGLETALMQLEEIGFGKPIQGDGYVEVLDTQLDALQMCLSAVGIIDTPQKQTLRALIALASPKQPLVLIGYSRGSAEIGRALWEHVEQANERGEEDVQNRLRESVTVVTIGTPFLKFVDGPAYVHVSSTKDPLVQYSKITRDTPERAGEGATFIHCNTPYAEGAFDNHNFAASVSQHLFLIMHMNKVKSFRDLYEKAGSEAGLDEPNNVDEITNALITVTRGAEYIWNRSEAINGNGYVPLPGRPEAIATLQRNLGQEFVERLISKFP